MHEPEACQRIGQATLVAAVHLAPQGRRLAVERAPSLEARGVSHATMCHGVYGVSCNHVMCHGVYGVYGVSCVMYSCSHVSCVMYHVPCVMCHVLMCHVPCATHVPLMCHSRDTHVLLT